MTIIEYLTKYDVKMSDFAPGIGATKGMVSKWANGHVRPSARMMRAIFRATNGAVTPNDFFDVSVPPAPDTPSTDEDAA